MTILVSYARQVLTGCPPGHYSAAQLTEFVEVLAPGAAWLELQRATVGDLKVLGEDISLTEFVKVMFLDRLEIPGPTAFFPILIPKSLLASHDTWDEWLTLCAFMAPHSLSPFIVFRNEPIARPSGEPVYLCDVRFGFDSGFVHEP